ncbi:PE-PPE domain-containing protein [Mycolicibacter sp. MYC123]|uniref:PE-PPE domain-containing protein n=1 Tax=[Mycobacterium] zoologicum TaxID=2872311 RepID=A0ABU5YG22_9MYCO|nr:PE-PPE domain-containing protein [Mycolicibacter sp. MYC123]MEB3048791.1 PE-PPE domain-containing protein [Mycolicibacter sp. MYC123]
MARLIAVALIGAAASALTCAEVLSAPSARADTLAAADSALSEGATRITVPGSGPLYYPNFFTGFPGLGQGYLPGIIDDPDLSILGAYDQINHEIGENWFPGSTPQVVNYPASMGILSGSLAAPGVDDAVSAGRQALNDQITNAVDNGNGSVVYVAALSEGTLVLDRELAYLATDPNAPAADALKFVSISSPEIGLFDIYMRVGSTIPVVDYTAGIIPDTQYDVDVLFHQYDFWADPPDRPWNLLADLNSLFALNYYHSPAALAAPSDAVQLSSVTDSLGGTVTTYMITSSTLPMLQPLVGLGLPEQFIDDLNSWLTPLVDQGYSSLTPDAGPYFAQGELVGLDGLWPDLDHLLG